MMSCPEENKFSSVFIYILIDSTKLQQNDFTRQLDQVNIQL